MDKYKKAKKRIFDIIQIGSRSDTISLSFDIFIVALIVISIVVTFMQTFDELERIMPILNGIELFNMIIFMIEYLLRIWTADCLHPDKSRGRAILMFVLSFYGVVDLLSFLPYFLPFFLPSGAVAFRMFRVVRILRLFRINSQYDAFNIIIDVLKDKKDQLLSSIFIVFILMLASSLCMYGIEHEVQPENFSNAFSGIWWSVSTLLTVGYGDIYPVTVLGRAMAIIIAFLGVLIVAIPTGIISAGFVEYYTKVKVGEYSRHEASFVSLTIDAEHPFIGMRLGLLPIPKGLFVAVVLRGEDVCTAYPNLLIEQGDTLLLGTTITRHIDCKVEEVVIEDGHPWNDQYIKELDISRQTFIIMIKRKNRNIKPEGDTLLKTGDTVLLLTKYKSERKKTN